MTSLTRAAVVIVAVAVLLLGLLWLFQRRLIYLPDRSLVPPAGEVIPGARDVSFVTGDGLRLSAWYVPGVRDVTVLVVGGNAGNGESLGAAVATRLAWEHPPVGLVLRSPFTDLAAAGQVNYPFLPVRLLLRDRFPVAERIGDVRTPTVVVYGTRDTIVPAWLSREVVKAAGGQVTTVEVMGAGHNDPAMLNGHELIRAVVELAERA
ncbi:alpha/beta hydrolase [Nonomuraea sp. NPDC049028]|uniref:alpha/beta hydrolase n=1 Tax=Nonomuraea sp. NPDC049028 TaxID=3364348 RepID=UPI003722B693